MENIFKDSQFKILIKLVALGLVVFLFAQTMVTLREYFAVYLNTQSGEITVSGKGEVKATPDTAVFTFSVVKTGNDKTQIQNDMAMRVKKVTEYLKQKGVEDKNIKTLSFNIAPRYEWMDGKRISQGYEGRQTVQVKTKQKDVAGTLVAEVVSKGADSVGSVRFEIEDKDTLQDTARSKAIDDARQKARTLAKELGVKVIGVKSFSENNYGRPVPMYAARAYAKSEDVTPLPAELPTGENTITSNLTIVYKIK